MMARPAGKRRADVTLTAICAATLTQEKLIALTENPTTR